jgi:hypothetical protein
MVYTRETARISLQKAQNATHPHHDTPTKSKIRGTVEALDRRGIYNASTTKTSIFEEFGVSKTRGYAMLKSSATDRRFPHSGETETRGRPHKITPDQIETMEHILHNADFHGRAMTWEALGHEARLYDVSARTIQREMGCLNYHKCVACRKGWVSEKLANRRKDFAITMLERYPNIDQWKRVRFSDETHIGISPLGRVYIIRRPGERFCKNCIQLEPPDEVIKKRIHAWAAVGWNFKSDLILYNVPGNSNGKMSLKTYHDQILEPVVKPWLERGDDFVLEEDQDSGHGMKGKKPQENLVQEWKREHHLQHYFNGSHCPDLVPIEDAWLAMKQFIRKYSYWEPDQIQQLAMEGWYDHVGVEYINRQVMDIPRRLHELIDREGQLISTPAIKKH